MRPDLVIPQILTYATAFVVVPVAACAFLDAGEPQELTCPETGKPASVRRSPGRAVLAMFTPMHERVCACSRWPERAGCDRACEPQLRSW
jgi:hypothetical protein